MFPAFASCKISGWVKPAAGETTPENWMDDPGFALTQGNWEEKANDMWGCKLFAESGESLDRTFEMP